MRTTKFSNSLKSLQTARDCKDQEIREIKAKLALAEKAKEEIEMQIRKLTEEIVISEHAILRYLERVKGVDIEEIKKEILPEETAVLVRKMGQAEGTYNTCTHKLRVKENVVITVMTDKNDY